MVYNDLIQCIYYVDVEMVCYFWQVDLYIQYIFCRIREYRYVLFKCYIVYINCLVRYVVVEVNWIKWDVYSVYFNKMVVEVISCIIVINVGIDVFLFVRAIFEFVCCCRVFRNLYGNCVDVIVIQVRYFNIVEIVEVIGQEYIVWVQFVSFYEQ